jgi:hypothetical protein
MESNPKQNASNLSNIPNLVINAQSIKDFHINLKQSFYVKYKTLAKLA